MGATTLKDLVMKSLFLIGTLTALQRPEQAPYLG